MHFDLAHCRTGVPQRTAGLVLIAVLAVLLFALPAAAENRVGGHFGVVLPLVTTFDGETTDITDNFQIGFPTGITVKKSDRVAFDLEFVPAIDNEVVDLVLHPGVLVDVGSCTVGVRAAFEVNSGAYGFTPLVAKGFPLKGQTASYFIELDLPVRVVDNALGQKKTSVTLAFHTGIGF